MLEISYISNESVNTLEAFDGRGSRAYGILTSFPITLEGKIAKLEVEVVNANMHYSLLLGQIWIHTMFFVVSSLFRVLRFPHEGKIVTVNQFSFFSSSASNGNVPYESVGAGIFKYYALMGNFFSPTSVCRLDQHDLCFYKPMIIPSLDHVDSFGDAMSLSPLEEAYHEIVLASTTTSESHHVLNMYMDTYSQSHWICSWDSLDPLNEIFPTDESIV